MENIIYETIIGSHAYGTNIETSDIDIKGVYIQHNDDILGLKYKEQTNVDKDTTFYEVRRFIELLGSGNPTMLEMLFVDPKFIKRKHPVFDILIKNRHLFLTKGCKNSFGGYAYAQIKKATGLEKKMNWDQQRITRKTPIDFCFIQFKNGAVPLTKFLKENDLKQEYCGLSAITNMPNNYLLYYDYVAQYGKEVNTNNYIELGYRGIQFEDSNDIRLSSIPKEQADDVKGVIYYNKDAYSKHCREYNEYETWLKNRNTNRYVKTSDQQIDGKNMMHCMRLLQCGIEIAKTGTFQVFRPNAKELIQIRNGDFSSQELISNANLLLEELNTSFDNCSLPEEVSFDTKHNLLLEVRHGYTF